MENIFNETVYYGDTDAYGVVWHGAYLRWMEKGRILLCEDLGINFEELKEQDDVVMPVTSLNIKYKSPAKLGETIRIRTTIIKITPLSVTFHQTISNSKTGQLHTDAEVTGVAVNNVGKLYKRFPDKIKNLLTEDIICKD